MSREKNRNNPIVAAMEDFEAYYGEGSTGLMDTIFGHWFEPGVEQSKEFAQQVSLQQMQNEWNSEQEKMRRSKEAGINPATAAANIAGDSAPSAGAPNSSSGAGASLPSAIDAANNAASVVTDIPLKRSQAKANDSTANLNNENAGQVKPLANAEIASKMGKLAKDYEECGLDSIAAAAASIVIGSGDYSTVLHILQSDEKIRGYERKMNLLKEQIRVENRKWKELESQVYLNQALEGEATANENYLAAKEQHEQVLQRLDELQEQIMNGMRADPYWSEFQAGWNIASKYGTDSEQYRNYMTFTKDFWYNRQKGYNQAEIEDIYDKVFNEIKANAAWKPYLSKIEAQKQHLIDIVKYQLENPDDIRGFYAKILNMIGSIFGVMEIEGNSEVSGAVPPSK